MQKHVAEWIQENKQILIDAVEKAARDGAGKIIMKFLDYRFAQMFSNAIENMKMEMRP